MRKLFAPLLMLLALLAVMPGALAAEDAQTVEFYEAIDGANLPVVSFFGNAEWEDGWTSYKDQLTGDALTVYQALETAFAADSVTPETVKINGVPTVCWKVDVKETFSYTSSEDFNVKYDEWWEGKALAIISACQSFSYDHPEYFWIRQSYMYGSSASGSNGTATATLMAGFIAQPSCDTVAERDALQEQLTPVIASILSAVEGKTTVEKLAYFDNWLAENNHYNHTAAGTDNYIKTDDTPWSIVGALLDDYSPVCEGYAKAFQLICHKVGVPCVQVSGVANGGGHMWAAAKLGDVWYFCDPTWDDPTFTGGSDGDTSTETYFLTAQPSSHAATMSLITPTISTVSYADRKFMPTNLAWGTYWFETETGAVQGIPVAGMMSWQVADTTVDNEYEIRVYREETTADTLVYESTYYYRAGTSGLCTEHDFSNRFPHSSLSSGDYYFTVRNVAGGDTVTSGIWTYAGPGAQLETRTYLSWNGPTATWDECYDWDYLDYFCGYAVDWYYGDRAGVSTTAELTKLGGFVRYFGEGSTECYQVIPEELLNNAGYYYFTVRFLSSDVSVVGHSGRMLSEAYSYEQTQSGIDYEGVLTILNGKDAGDGYTTKNEGWVWQNGTLTLETVEGVNIRAVQFRPYVGNAEIVLNSDVTLDADGVFALDSNSVKMQSAIEMESKEHVLTIRTGGYTLTCHSEVNGIHAGGSLVIDGSTVTANGEDNCIYVEQGDMTIRNSTVTAHQSLYGWGIYAHGIRVEEDQQCEMGNLTISNSTVTVTSSEEEGSGNAVYADGDIFINASSVDANGDKNGIGNDVGSIIIRDSTVHAVGEYIGICTYGTLTIDNSYVTAETTTEGNRGIELTVWDPEKKPAVESFVLTDCKIVTPEKHNIALVSVKCGGEDLSWYDDVVTVTDLSDSNNVVPAMKVIIEPAKFTLSDRLEALIPNEGGSITVEKAQNALVSRVDEIKAALTADRNESGGVVELLREVESAITDVTAKVTTTTETAGFAGAKIDGAKLNAKEGTEEVELQIAKATKEHKAEGKYSDLSSFSMSLSGVENAEQLIVPVKITLPVPADINPAFLVVLHYKADGSVEEIVPYVYQEDGAWFASFVVTSFSDFAMAAVTIDAETTETGVQVEANFAVALEGQAICAVYDEYGKQLGVTVLESMTAGEQVLDIACDASKAHTVKLFVLNGDSAPLYVESPCTLNAVESE